MTNNSDVVEVTAEDRRAYLEWSTLPPRDAAAVLAGEWDKTTGMQVLAKHRIAAEQRLREQVGRLASQLQACRDQFQFYTDQHMAKSPPDTIKAHTNREFAKACDEALADYRKFTEGS